MKMWTKVHAIYLAVLLLNFTHQALTAKVSEITIKTGSDGTDSDIAAKICDRAGVCCETNALDNSGNDFEVGQTDIFKEKQLLGECSEDVLDPQTGNLTVKLKKMDGFLRLGTWSVDWVEIRTDAPKITFRCNVSALLDPKLKDVVRSTAIKEEDKASVGASCQPTGATGPENQIMHFWVPIISAAVFVVAICVIVVIVWKTRCQKRSNRHQAKEVDNNPVYGLYFTSEGERIDEGVAEVVDENSDYYGR